MTAEYNTRPAAISIAEAEKMIDEVKSRWVSLGRKPETLYLYDNHIRGAALVAHTIAEKINGINPEKAYIACLLHDIGKIDESPESMLGRGHFILGYERLKDIDPDIAQTCLLHEFPYNIVPPFEDCHKRLLDNRQDYDFIVDYVSKIQTEDLDLLVQLADLMANQDGLVTIELRIKDWEIRHKTTFPPARAAAYFAVKNHFDNKLGGDVYDLFPDIKRL